MILTLHHHRHLFMQPVDVPRVVSRFAKSIAPTNLAPGDRLRIPIVGSPGISGSVRNAEQVR